MTTPAVAVAAWTRALQRCVASRSHALVDASDGVVLIFVDAPRVVHPVLALVADRPARDGNEDDEAPTAPLVVVMRVHPAVMALVEKLNEANAPAEGVDAMLASLLFRDRQVANVNGAMPQAMMTVPLFASRVVNLDGGALRLYGEMPQSASQALTMTTLAINGGAARLTTDIDRIVVVAEHRDGYLARDYMVGTPDTNVPHKFSRVMTIQKREWDSGSIAQLSLDDALEAYEAGFLEEQEINGNTEVLAASRSLTITVSAVFEVRESMHATRGSMFLADMDDIGGGPSSTAVTPPILLFSQWEGLENVRSLLCKPPPQSSSTLCFSGTGRTSEPSNRAGSRLSLALLHHLDQAIRDVSSHHTWRSLRSERTASDIIQRFKKFLRTIDDGDAPMDGDDTINNTIESSASLVLDGERQRTPNASSRADMDPIEKLWDFVAKNADSAEVTQQLVQEFIIFLSSTRIFPAPHPDNNTELAKLVRLRQDEIQGNARSSFVSIAQQALEQATDAYAFLIEAGEWKMKRDVAHALAQAGFSSQESSEIVLAMPRFNVQTRSTTSTCWTAMDHVLQLCVSALSIQLPVSFTRKAVHECVAYYIRKGASETAVEPRVLVDLQSFIPERLRSSIADPLYWDMRVAFTADYEHRVRICRDGFHPTVQSGGSVRSFLPSVEFALDDATLHALHRNTPEELLMNSEMVAFMAKLEDDREKRLYEQLHDIDIPFGMARYDCTVRRLPGFP